MPLSANAHRNSGKIYEIRHEFPSALSCSVMAKYSYRQDTFYLVLSCEDKLSWGMILFWRPRKTKMMRQMHAIKWAFGAISAAEAWLLSCRPACHTENIQLFPPPCHASWNWAMPSIIVNVERAFILLAYRFRPISILGFIVMRMNIWEHHRL